MVWVETGAVVACVRAFVHIVGWVGEGRAAAAVGQGARRARAAAPPPLPPTKPPCPPPSPRSLPPSMRVPRAGHHPLRPRVVAGRAHSAKGMAGGAPHHPVHRGAEGGGGGERGGKGATGDGCVAIKMPNGRGVVGEALADGLRVCVCVCGGGGQEGKGWTSRLPIGACGAPLARGTPPPPTHTQPPTHSPTPTHPPAACAHSPSRARAARPPAARAWGPHPTAAPPPARTSAGCQ